MKRWGLVNYGGVWARGGEIRHNHGDVDEHECSHEGLSQAHVNLHKYEGMSKIKLVGIVDKLVEDYDDTNVGSSGLRLIKKRGLN